MIDWAQIGKALSAFLAPVIAVVVTIIAVAQYYINRRQYRLALFDRRMAVFNSTMNMIASVVRSANPTLDECFKFIKDTRDHELLFGPDVGALIDDIYKKATALHAHIAAPGPNSPAQQTEIMEWFIGRMGEARRVFLRYLDFRKP